VFCDILAWPSAHGRANGRRYQKDTTPDAGFARLPPPRHRPACALTIGNFDGVHRGHQAMLALLNSEARHRGVPSCVLTFEPHPRDYFAAQAPQARTGAGAHRHAARQAHRAGQACGVDQCVVLPFDARLSSQVPEAFIDDVLVDGLGAKYVLVGDDFRFGAKRAGDYAMLDAAGSRPGLRRGAHEQLRGARPARVQLGRARGAGAGDMAGVAALLGRPYSISGHVVHGRKLGRELGFAPSTCAFRTGSRPPAASSRCWCTAWASSPLPGVANLGIRPSLDPRDVNGGRVLLETHCLEWPAGLGTRGATVKSSAWNCCTNCTTSCATTASMP
jgi:riboflavin kinase/FMN adenylyltransferase